MYFVTLSANWKVVLQFPCLLLKLFLCLQLVMPWSMYSAVRAKLLQTETQKCSSLHEELNEKGNTLKLLLTVRLEHGQER